MWASLIAEPWPVKLAAVSVLMGVIWILYVALFWR